jgi:hypothetical protein
MGRPYAGTMRGVVSTARDRIRAVRTAPGRGIRGLSGRVAGVGRLPTSARAVFAHYANGGDLDLAALRLQPRVEASLEAMVDRAFDPVETAVAAEFDFDPDAVEFDYGTKLLMPVELTLARHYRSVIRRAPDGFDPIEAEVSPGLIGRLPGVGSHGTGRIEAEFSNLVREVERIDRATALVVVALLDGDMRDAINDDEFEDFEADVVDGAEDRRRVAEIAQETLESEVEARFRRFPDGVEEVYDRAVAASEAHQASDERFRELFEAAKAGDADARAGIRTEYRDASFADPPEGYDSADLELPYFRTQYDRVGVIYDGMMEMYGEVGLGVDDDFRRAIVLAIIGAQVWLDDVDDFEADLAEGQLTPVTAEYVLADTEAAAYDRVLALTDRYAERARQYAARSDSTLVGIAVEYILLSGDPGALPGAPDDATPPGVPGDDA